MKKVYIVTHGAYQENKPDPPLTPEGVEQMKSLKEFLPEKIDFVVSGIGKRHQQAFKILLGPRVPDLKSEPVGVRESLSPDQKELIFSNGKKVPIKEYMKTRYAQLQKSISSFLREEVFEKEGENALIVGGRIAVMALGIQDVKSGVLYIFDKNQKLIKTHEARGLS